MQSLSKDCHLMMEMKATSFQLRRCFILIFLRHTAQQSFLFILAIDNPKVTGGRSSPESAPGAGRQVVLRGQPVTSPMTEAQIKYCGGREEPILA